MTMSRSPCDLTMSKTSCTTRSKNGEIWWTHPLRYRSCRPRDLEEMGIGWRSSANSSVCFPPPPQGSCRRRCIPCLWGSACQITGTQHQYSHSQDRYQTKARSFSWMRTVMQCDAPSSLLAVVYRYMPTMHDVTYFRRKPLVYLCPLSVACVVSLTHLDTE